MGQKYPQKFIYLGPTKINNYTVLLYSILDSLPLLTWRWRLTGVFPLYTQQITMPMMRMTHTTPPTTAPI